MIVVSLALAPFVAVMVTSFTKIVVVLSLLRNALGLQQVPPNVVINGLAIVLSIYVMYPVILDTHAAVSAHMDGRPPPAHVAQQAAVNTPMDPSPVAIRNPAGVTTTVDTSAATVGEPATAVQPLVEDEAVEPAPSTATGGGSGLEGMTVDRLIELVDVGKEPLRAFLIHHSSDAERAFFLRSAQRLLPPGKRDQVGVDDFIVVVPAFTVSELTAAFQIGFLIFLPFLIIDLVVGNILLALGMMMMSPTTVSLPLKLLLFVLIDGWAKLVHGLVLTYSM
nr:EscR/YscR/HrcR family type III secretion system export apparatus protein [Lysobacter sp. GX 14042]